MERAEGKELLRRAEQYHRTLAPHIKDRLAGQLIEELCRELRGIDSVLADRPELAAIQSRVEKIAYCVGLPHITVTTAPPALEQRFTLIEEAVLANCGECDIEWACFKNGALCIRKP